MPENPPESFYEALQFIWFADRRDSVGNSSSLNPVFRPVQDPYLRSGSRERARSRRTPRRSSSALWLKYSEWGLTISSNTADYFAGYNQFQNLTVGGKKRDGSDGTNPITYMALKATEEVKTHQPGLSVRVQADCPKEFLDAVRHLVAQGTGFPAIHQRCRGLSDAPERWL